MANVIWLWSDILLGILLVSVTFFFLTARFTDTWGAYYLHQSSGRDPVPGEHGPPA